MENTIILANKDLNYTLRRSFRARYLRITIKRGGKVIVTLPYLMMKRRAESFLRKKADWVLKKVKEAKKVRNLANIGTITNSNYEKNKEKALKMIKPLLDKYSREYGLKYNRIRIKKQKTMWASCSPQKNLNFNYKILYLPKDIAEYIIVHELCHIKELNHSKRFWKLVERVFPNHRDLRKKLLDY